jgi:acetoin utilization deacetylase AcuC-like enzyme
MLGGVIIFHDERCAGYATPGHPERPERVTRSALHLRAAHPKWEWRVPPAATREMLLRAHTEAHLARLGGGKNFDADTPAHEGIFDHAARSAGAAVECARAALRGERAFSLMRPPGHHATREQAMGFCYLGSIAIAALDALAGGLKRVAIWDFDGHHGNGTEAICEDDLRIRFVSTHQHPAYPGTGKVSRKNVFNFPLPPNSPHLHQIGTLRSSWDCVLAFEPQLILVSAGFDAYVRDPLLSLDFEIADYHSFGQWLAQSKIPATAILEGGYSDDLPKLIDAFLTGWEP